MLRNLLYKPGGFRCVIALLSFWALHAVSLNAGELPLLSTVSGSPRLPGKFVWADLVTDDTAAAQAFYTRLFGWRFYDTGGYAIGLNDERPLCGMFQRPRPKDQSAHPRWFGYISVPSVAKAEKTVTNLGGKVMAAAREFPKRGAQAVFADPEGALFGVIKSTSGDPGDFKPDLGDWIWIQLMSRDGRKATEFYSKIAGYKVVENTSATRLSDYVLTSGGYARATVRTIPPEQEDVRPTWLAFVRVASVKEKVDQARNLGGKVLLDPKPELLDGKVAVIADPTGAAIGLMEWIDATQKGGR